MRNAEVLGRDRRPGLPDRARPVQHRDQRAAAAAAPATVARRARDRASGPASTTPTSVANEVGAHMVMIGILPTLRREHLTERHALAPTRATRCSTSRSSPPAARTSRIDIDGVERLSTPRRLDRARGGLHQHPVPPAGQPGDVRRATGTPSQAIAGVQLAVGANSPFLFGKELWRETRIAAVRAGHRHPAARSSRRRACGRGCGSASAGSPRSSTCSRRTSATSRRCCRSATTRTRSRCSSAATSRSSAELRLHNGTIYRWNRPVYDVVDGRPHLRVENRVLPAGPTVVDMMANAAFYFGLVRALAEARPAGVVADVVQRRRGELPRRAPGTASTRSVYWPGRRRGAGHRAGAAPAAAAGPRGPGRVGRRRRRARPAARHHRAALPDRAQRRGLAGRRRSTGCSSEQLDRPRRAARDAAARTSSTCTPTSRCTPGRRCRQVQPPDYGQAGSLVAAPGREQPAVVRDELVVLVRAGTSSVTVSTRTRSKSGRLEVVQRHLVQVARAGTRRSRGSARCRSSSSASAR